MSAIQSNCGEFAIFKPLEFEGFGTECSIAPVAFDGVGCQGDARA